MKQCESGAGPEAPLPLDPEAPRQVILRFPAQPSKHGPIGAVFHMPTAAQAIGELVRRLGVEAERLECLEIDACGKRLAVIELRPEAPRLSRIAAFVLDGLTLLELKIGLAYLREATLEKRA
jgi:hypothetical protein